MITIGQASDIFDNEISLPGVYIYFIDSNRAVLFMMVMF